MPKSSDFGPDTMWLKISQKAKKNQVKNQLLCQIALFSFIFKQNNFTYGRYPFALHISCGIAQPIKISF